MQEETRREGIDDIPRVRRLLDQPETTEGTGDFGLCHIVHNGGRADGRAEDEMEATIDDLLVPANDLDHLRHLKVGDRW